MMIEFNRDFILKNTLLCLVLGHNIVVRLFSLLVGRHKLSHDILGD